MMAALSLALLEALMRSNTPDGRTVITGSCSTDDIEEQNRGGPLKHAQ